MRKIFLILWLYLLSFSSVSAWLFISEVFPNTTDDKNLEYIELINISEEDIDISEYYLQDKSEKKYVFPEDEIITSGEKKRYLRPDTKLILNNSNEEIYLYDNSDQVLDSLLYTTSEKWEVILWENIPEEANLDETEDSDILDESEVPELSVDDSIWLLSWLFDEEISDQELEIEKVLFPEVRWKFQQPTYLENKDELIYAYQCDREDCKINLDLRDSFHSGMKESDYRCEIDFGFETWQEQRCNPNTVLFWTGSFDVEMKIFSKANDSLVSESRFIVDNIPKTILLPLLEGEVTQDLWQGESEYQEQNNIDEYQEEWIDEDVAEEQEVFIAPDVVVWLQRPSYVEESLWLYTCDTSREECKINFDFRESFSDELPERDYICKTDFWFETWEENKCNPNTITFPIGTHQVTVQIIHEDDETVFSEKRLLIQNDGYREAVSSTSSTNSYESSWLPRKYLAPATIDIQSGLEYRDGKLYCTKDECKINLKHEKSSDYEVCIWAFWKWAQYNNGTQNRCNPWYVTYPKWEFTVYLQVYQKDLSNNFRESQISFKSKESELISEDISVEEAFKNDEIIAVNTEVESGSEELKIVLQGRIWKTKKIEENKITCIESEKCYVNFDAEGWVWEYNWDFWNGEIFTWKNPKWIWFKSWEYEVTLRSSESQTVFFVHVYRDVEMELSQWNEVQKSGVDASEILDSNQFEYFDYSKLVIHALSPNPKGNDVKEWFEIKNNWPEKINLLWCEIDDDIWKWSSSYKIKEDLILDSWEVRRFYKLFTKLNLNNTTDSLNLICNKWLVDTLTWDFKITDNLVLSHDYPNWRISTRKDTFYSDEQYKEFMEKTFIQNQRLLKNWLKISGETLPNTSIKIVLWNNMKDIYALTDNNWLYEVLLDTWLIAWNIKVGVEVFADDNVYVFKNDDDLEITSEYIQSLIDTKKRKTKKVTTKKPNTYLVSVANASETWDIRKENNYDILLFLIIIFWFLLSFLAIKKRWILD